MAQVMARGVIAACLLLSFQGCSFVTSAGAPTIRFDSGRNLFVLEGWTGSRAVNLDRGGDVFTVSVDAPNVPALLGNYRVENGALVFAPQFPLQAGMSYRAVARIPGNAPISSVFSIPKPDATPTTVVERVYPSADTLPENQLKFYIHFSSGMAKGFAYEHVSLIDESGARVDAPFLELGEELWDPTGRRFTLFFDPGRIKRGLLSQQELGIALHEGKRYTLLIDKGWKDAQGRPLVADFRKTFTVGPADRQPIDLKAWTIRAPQSDTRNVLTISFPEPLDHAILHREIDIVTSTGTVITGGVEVGPGERSWIFTPDAPWKKGAYVARVGATLADLAGNMVNRPFEIDVFDKVDENLNRVTQSLEFKIE
jgi:hypothetical protein